MRGRSEWIADQTLTWTCRGAGAQHSAPPPCRLSTHDKDALFNVLEEGQFAPSQSDYSTVSDVWSDNVVTM